MGGCLGTPVDHPGGGGRRRGSGGGRGGGGGGDPNRSSSRRGSGFSDSTSSGLPQTTKVRINFAFVFYVICSIHRDGLDLVQDIKIRYAFLLIIDHILIIED